MIALHRVKQLDEKLDSGQPLSVSEIRDVLSVVRIALETLSRPELYPDTQADGIEFCGKCGKCK